MGKKVEAMRRSRAKKAAAGIITARQARNLQSDRGKLLPTVPTVDGVGGTFLWCDIIAGWAGRSERCQMLHSVGSMMPCS